MVTIPLGQHDASTEKPAVFGLTPFYCASERGRQGSVKIVLRRDNVNPKQPG